MKSIIFTVIFTLLIFEPAAAWFSSTRETPYCAVCVNPHCNGTLSHAPREAESADFRQRRGEGLVYLFVTGPYLYDPMFVARGGRLPRFIRWHPEPQSLYAKKVVNGLIERIEHDYPYAQTLHLSAFRPQELHEAYEVLRNGPRRVDRIMLMVVSHGGTGDDGSFFMSSDGGAFAEQELLSIIRDTPTQTSLFTCRSGALKVDNFPGAVFGASLEHTNLDAEHFYHWAKFVLADQDVYFPSSAREVYDTFLESRVDLDVDEENKTWWNSLLPFLKPDVSDKKRARVANFSDACWGKSRPFFYAHK